MKRVLLDWEAHEGMVTVYDSEGRYMGCMGIETWKRIAEEGERKRRERGHQKDTPSGDVVPEGTK